MYTRLSFVNHVLSLVGENQLTTTDNQLGRLVVNVINTAIASVAQETRHNAFETLLTATITETDYLLPGYTIPTNVLQILDVTVRVSVDGFGDVIDSLCFVPFHLLDSDTGYSIINGSLYISKCVARPLTCILHTINTQTLPANDSTTLTLPDQVLYAVAHVAAGILCVSYLDNPNAAAIQNNLAETLQDKIKKQQGIGRGKTYSLTPDSKRRRGLSQTYHAPLYLTETTADAKYLTIANAASTYQTIADMSSYLSTTDAASTYQTIAGMGAYQTVAGMGAYLTVTAASGTYQPITGMSAYLTTANAASTYQTIIGMSAYAPLISPALSGTPTTPTASFGNSTTQISSTAFVQTAIAGEGWTNLTYAANWASFGSTFAPVQYRKVGNDVFLRGLAARPTVAGGVGTTIGTLPVGYRPAYDIIFPTIAKDTASASIYSSYLYINTSGAIILQAYLYGGANTRTEFVSFDNVSFAINL